MATVLEKKLEEVCGLAFFKLLVGVGSKVCSIIEGWAVGAAKYSALSVWKIADIFFQNMRMRDHGFGS